MILLMLHQHHLITVSHTVLYSSIAPKRVTSSSHIILRSIDRSFAGTEMDKGDHVGIFPRATTTTLIVIHLLLSNTSDTHWTSKQLLLSIEFCHVLMLCSTVSKPKCGLLRLILNSTRLISFHTKFGSRGLAIREQLLVTKTKWRPKMNH